MSTAPSPTPSATGSRVLLEVRNLKKHFPIRGGVFSRIRGWVRAVDDVSFSIAQGETYALVGESGCGKSTTGSVILRLIEPTSGEVSYGGRNVFALKPGELRSVRRSMQMIFQDPYSALNPRMTVGEAIREMLSIHGIATGAAAKEEAQRVLSLCGLAPYHAKRYPHEFSGGQRQRVVIARALALNPQFVVADEPISSLDVSIQSQIINLLQELQEKFDLTYLFISHDLSVVHHMADRVGVMYLGHLVEEAEKHAFYAEPLHPYSQALLSAIPRSDPTIKRERMVLQGDVPSPATPPPGCTFHTRCPFARESCRVHVPELKHTPQGRRVACHMVHGDHDFAGTG